MPSRIYPSYNPWFLVPFIIWVVVGGGMLLAFDQETLSYAVNKRNTPFLDVWIYRVTALGEGYTIPPVLIGLWLLVPGLRNRWFITTAIVCCGLSAVLVHLIKHLLHHARPLKVLTDTNLLHFDDNWHKLYDYSFPSGHSAGAFSMFCLISFLLPQRFRPWGLLLFLLAAAVGYSRIYLLAHWFVDVYAGSILGVVFCLVFFGVMHRLEPAFFGEHWQRHKRRISGGGSWGRKQPEANIRNSAGSNQD